MTANEAPSWEGMADSDLFAEIEPRPADTDLRVFIAACVATLVACAAHLTHPSMLTLVVVAALTTFAAAFGILAALVPEDRS